MDFSELKKLMKKLGGVLVMDGEEPSFVMLSYENYSDLVREEEKEVFVHNESLLARGKAGLAAALEDNETILINATEEFEETDEDKIKRLNEEIEILKNDLKQKELETAAQLGE